MAVKKRPGNKAKQQIETPGIRQEKPEGSVDIVEQLEKKQQELQVANEKLKAAEQELRARTQELTSSEKRFKYNLEALTRIQELSRRLLESGGLNPPLQDIMDAAVELMAAERGTLQLFEGSSIRIVAHNGHRKEFLDFFEAAENVASVCGEATHRGERVIVHDVEASPLFIGTPSLLILRRYNSL